MFSGVCRCCGGVVNLLNLPNLPGLVGWWVVGAVKSTSSPALWYTSCEDVGQRGGVITDRLQANNSKPAFNTATMPPPTPFHKHHPSAEVIHKPHANAFTPALPPHATTTTTNPSHLHTTKLLKVNPVTPYPPLQQAKYTSSKTPPPPPETATTQALANPPAPAPAAAHPSACFPEFLAPVRFGGEEDGKVLGAEFRNPGCCCGARRGLCQLCCGVGGRGRPATGRWLHGRESGFGR